MLLKHVQVSNMDLVNEIKRKLIHVSSVWMVLAVYFLEKETAIMFFGALSVALFIFEYFRMSNETLQKISAKLFSKIIRPNENVTRFTIGGLTGSFFFVLSVFFSVIFFSKEVAMASITVMIFSDTAAALIGKAIGKRKILDKTIEGSLAFFITTLIVLYFFVDIKIYEMVIVAFVVTVVELISNKIKINDNLSITLCTGVLLSVFLLT